MQCKAKSKQSKKRCKRRAIKGGTVCSMHGGGAPQVKKKARERLNDLVDPAINKLAAVLEDSALSHTAISAAKDVLDRTGFKPTDKIKFEEDIEVYDPGREKLSDDELERLIALLEQSEGDQE